MPETARGQTRLTLRVLERATDFARGSRRVLYGPGGCCCCCCCLWSIGGVAGSLIGSLAGQTAGERHHGVHPSQLNRELWKGMLYGLGVFCLGLWICDPDHFHVHMFWIGMPAVLPFAALGGALTVGYNVPDPRAFRIAGRAMGTMVLGGLAGSLAGFAVVALAFAPTYVLPAAGGALASGLLTVLLCAARSRAPGLPEGFLGLRLPEAAADRAVIAIVDAAPAAADEAMCPICGDLLGDGPVTSCDRCETPHHQDCWDYFGGCAVFGCSPTGPGDPAPTAPEGLAPLVRSWFLWSRLRWWSYLAGALSIALAPVLYCVDPRQGGHVSLLLAGIVGLVVFAATAWPDLEARARLSEALRSPVEPDDQVITAVLRRVGESHSEPLLHRAAEFAPRAYAVLALLCLPPLFRGSMVPDGMAVGGCLLALLAGWAITLHAANRARRRQVISDTLTGRLHAAQLVAARSARRG